MKIKNIFITIILLHLASCQSFMHMEQQTKPEIMLVCNKHCLTLTTKDNLQKRINSFLKHWPKNKTVKVSNCTSIADASLTKATLKYIHHKGYRATIVRSTEPYHNTQKPCVNLVKGFVSIKLPNCYPQIKSHAPTLVGHKFGCTSQYNLIKMIRNPNDLLILSGLNGNLY